MPWLVVKFIESNEIEVIPSSWFNKKTGICLYPSFPKNKLEKAIKQQIAPPEDAEDNWEEYKAQMMSHKEYENFQTANHLTFQKWRIFPKKESPRKFFCTVMTMMKQFYLPFQNHLLRHSHVSLDISYLLTGKFHKSCLELSLLDILVSSFYFSRQFALFLSEV